MDAKRKEIERLLRDGLEHYGDGDTEQAVKAWNAVLALDPRNADALDYIESAGARVDETVAADDASFEGGERTLLEQAVALLEGGREVDAHAVLEGVAGRGPLDIETLAVSELVRARLLPLFRAGFGTGAMPRATGDGARLAALGLAADALALHAACDGRTPIEALPAACGLDAFEAFHQLGVLVDAGLVSVYA